MAEKKKKLGKGLNSIFGEGLDDVINSIETPVVSSGGTIELNVDDIRPNPYQPRKVFADDKINELAESIREHGVFQPIIVRKSLAGYELIAGERRLRASKIAQMPTIPAIMVEFDDKKMMEVSLLENIQRENLTAIEEAEAYENLIEKLGYTQEELAERIGKSRPHISNMLRLLKLPFEIREMIAKEQLSFGHARCLVALENQDQAIEIAKTCIKEGWSVRQLEKYLKKLTETPKKPKNDDKDPYLENVRSIMEKRLGTSVEVTKKHLTISYNSNEDLNRILERIGCLDD